tara:strand:- start:667 stop:1227 length:561 start_codon:yes stop_codon:yes gene_type:complete
MAYQKLNYAQALTVIKSDTVRIPDPNSLILSLANETGDFTVKDTVTVAAGGLLTAGIQQNAIIYCPADKKCWYVVDIIDDTTLEIKGDDQNGSAGAVFQIYNRAAEGCNLYTGGFLSGNPGPTNKAYGGDLTVVMAEMNHSWTVADDVTGLSPITFFNVEPAQYHPINVLMVRKTGTDVENIVALW